MERPDGWQDRVVWFWDDNLLVDRTWAKTLLREMAGLRVPASVRQKIEAEIADLPFEERSAFLAVARNWMRSRG